MTKSGFETLLFHQADGLARITLNRPKALNAFNVQMRDELYQVLQVIKLADDIGVVILDGAGDKAFCAGADLTEFLSAPPPVKARQVRFARDVWQLFLSIPQPMIAALHGYVFGSGLEMALACDLRLAAEDTVFGLPEVSLGIIPAAGGTQTLPRTIGRSRALEMLLTDKRLTGQEALDCGLVTRLVPRPELAATAQELAERILSFDGRAVRAAKQAATRGADLPLEEGLRLEKLLAAGLKSGR